MKRTTIPEETKQQNILLSDLFIKVLDLRSLNMNVIRNHEKMNEYLNESLGLSLEALVVIPPSEFVMTMKRINGFDTGMLELFGDILYYMAKECNDDYKDLLYEKSKLIYNHVDDCDKVIL